MIPLPDTRPGPEAEALAHERTRAIEAGLNRLSPDHRAIILMRDLSDMSYEEIKMAFLQYYEKRLKLQLLQAEERLAALEKAPGSGPQ